jgi:predicted double-glycine peptidase
MRLNKVFAGLTLFVMFSSGLQVSAQSSRVVLDVPYLTQKDDLSGGAAVAMVFKYWGNGDLVAGDFRSAVDPREKGIPATALVKAVSTRGWRASILSAPDAANGSVADVAREVELGRPPIVRLEVSPKVYHYVVVVAVTNRDVVIHDPASRPFETMTRQQFSKRWSGAGSWALIVLPPTEPTSKPRHRTIDVTVPAGLPAKAECATLISQAVADSKSGDEAASERSLLLATSRCPENADAWRELAGLRFVNSQWAEAQTLAEKAVRAAPEDQRSWKILAASLYLRGNALEALRAWNRAGEPRVDTVIVSGANRTQEAVIRERIGLESQDLLTPSAFRRAARRASDLPVATDGIVRFFPHDDEGASLEVDIHEGAAYPFTLATLGNVVGRGLFIHEVRIPFAGPTGHGERIDVEYGWKRNRPRAAVRLTTPAPGRIPGLIVFEWSRSRQTFELAGDFGEGRHIEDSKGVRVGLEDWATGRIHWSVDGMYNRIAQGPFVAFGAGLDTRLLDDHVAILVDGSSWYGTDGGRAFRLTSTAVKWRQRTSAAAGGLSAEAGAAGASQETPLTFWSGADVGSSRQALLRGHKLLTDGVVTSQVFGRRFIFASSTYERPIRTFKYGTITVAGFVDSARPFKGIVPTWDVTQVDIGFGARLHSSTYGSVRADFGYGLRDGSTAVSAAFVREWPRR